MTLPTEKPEPHFSQREELVALGQALAMSDDTYLAVLVAEDKETIAKAIAEIQAAITDTEGAPLPLSVLPSPEDEQRTPEFLARQVIEQLLHPQSDNKIIRVLDASDATFPSSPIWLNLFRQLNNTRDGLMNRKGSHLLIILPRWLEKEFFYRAPDLWSVSSFLIDLVGDDSAQLPVSPEKRERFFSFHEPIRDPSAFLGTYDSEIATFIKSISIREGMLGLETDAFVSMVVALLSEDDGRRLRAFKGRSYFRTYLSSLARNLMIDYKQRLYRRTQGKEQSLPTSLEPPDTKAISPEQSVIPSEVREKLQEIMKTLPATDQLLIKLVYYVGVPVAEAAAKLNIEATTARYRLSRVFKRIRNELLINADEALTLVETFNWSQETLTQDRKQG